MASNYSCRNKVFRQIRSQAKSFSLKLWSLRYGVTTNSYYLCLPMMRSIEIKEHWNHTKKQTWATQNNKNHGPEPCAWDTNLILNPYALWLCNVHAKQNSISLISRVNNTENFQGLTASIALITWQDRAHMIRIIEPEYNTINEIEQ